MKRILLSLMAFLLATPSALADLAPISEPHSNDMIVLIDNYNDPATSSQTLMTTVGTIRSYAQEGNKRAQEFINKEFLAVDPKLDQKNGLNKKLQNRCEKKDADACSLLGKIYGYGLFGLWDFQRALSYFQKAEALGSKDMKREIGLLYLNFKGPEQSQEKALEWLKKASAAGDPFAQSLIDQMNVLEDP